MISNIVFDMGGVLIRWSPAEFLNRMGLNRADSDILLRELFGSPEWLLADEGRITPAQIAAAVKPRVPAHLHDAVDELANRWFERFLLPMPHMAELVRELKLAGFGIYLLSNAPTNLRTYFPRIPGSEFFDGILVSGEEKLLKPCREIYETLCDRFCLNPETCVFIDDNPANAAGAETIGMTGIFFKGDVSELRRELNGLGVPCGK